MAVNRLPEALEGDDSTGEAEALNRGEPIRIADAAGNEMAMTKLVTPEFYQTYMSRMAPRVATYGTPLPGSPWITAEAPTPPPEVLNSMYDTINEHWDSLNLHDPDTTARLLRYPHLVFEDAQLAGSVGRLFEYGPAEEAARWLLADANVLNYEDYEETWRATQTTRIFLDNYSKQFTPVELNVISTVFASLDTERRDRLSALAWQYWKSADINNPESRVQFLDWFYREGLKQNQEVLASYGSNASLFAIFEKPLEAVRGFVQQEIAPNILSMFTGVTKPGNPNEWSMRTSLTIGQQFAAASGYTPDEGTGWNTMSGTIDALNVFALDPWTYAFGIGIAAKVAKSVPRIGVAASSGRALLAARTFVPFVGRGVLGQNMRRMLPRGPFTRAAWAVLSKTGDELIENAGKRGVYDTMLRIGQTRGVAGLVEAFPDLERSAEGILTEIARSKDAGEVQELIKYAFNGAFLDETGDGFILLNRRLDDARTSYRRGFEAAVANRQISVQGIDEAIDGLSPSRFGTWATGDNAADAAQAAAGDIITPALTTNSDKLRLVWRSNARLIEVNADLVSRFSGWAPGRAPAAKSEVLAWFNGTGDLTARSKKVLLDFMSNEGIDGLAREVDGFLFVGRGGTSKMIRVVDNDTLGRSADHLMGLTEEVMRADTSLRSAKAGDRRRWVISDIPVSQPKLGFVRGLWKKHASNDSGGWWGNYRRTTSARFFGREYIPSVNLAHGWQGGKELRLFLRQLGAKRSTIQHWYNQFLAASPNRRFSVVEEAIISVADEIDHPILRHGLTQWSRKHGVFSYGLYDDSGAEMGMAASRSREGHASARPLIPSHFSDRFDLPGPEILTMLKRYRSARTQGRLGLSWNVHGLTGATRDRRTAIAKRYANWLKSRGVELPPEIGDQDLITWAYATILPGQDDGIGRVASFMERYPGRAWAGFHSLFTRAQLVLRPLTWPFRVAVLEEQTRAALMDQPSLYRNPFRMVAGWWDTYQVSMVNSWRGKQATFIRDATKKLTTSRSLDQALATASAELPGFAAWAGNRRLGNLGDLRAAIGRYLGEHVDSLANLKMGRTAGARLRNKVTRNSRRIQNAESKLREMGLEPDFDWGMVPGIAHRGLVQLLTEEAGAATHIVEYVPGGMTRQQLQWYGKTYGQRLMQAIEDPIVGRFGLGRARAFALGEDVGKWGARQLIETPGWRTVKDEWADVLEYRGVIVRGGLDEAGLAVPALTDTELAARYLDEVIDPYTAQLFNPIWGGDPTTKSRIADDILTSHSTHFEIEGEAYDLAITGENYHGFLSTIRRMVEDQHYNEAVQFPKKLAGYFDARFAMQDDGLFKSIRNISNRVLQFSGEKVTQVLNRRPAYLFTYRGWFDHYKGLGLTDDIARTMAHEKSVEAVNYVYYNMDNATPFLRKMNRVIPFFAAAWEVAQTWAYKIPFSRAGAVGAPSLVRKVDRTLDAFQNLGLIQLDVDEDQTTGERNTTMWLNFTDEPEQFAMTPLGAQLSKIGFSALQAPSIFAKQLVNIRNWFSSEDVDIDTGVQKDTYSFQVGNPLDWTSHGIMAVNQAYLAPNPIGGYALERFLQLIPAAADNRLIATESDNTLSDVARSAETDPIMFLRQNRMVIGDAIGYDKIKMILNGTLLPEDVDLPEGILLQIPGSSWMDTVLEDIAFPFGKVETGFGILRELAPQWSQYVFRGLGIWGAGGGDRFWTTDEQGNFVVDSQFLEMFSSPMDRTQVAGEINTQIMHLEASEGLISRWTEENAKLMAINQEALDAYGIELSEDTVSAEAPELQEAWEDQLLIVQELNTQITKRALDNAGFALVMRGITGFMSPTNPRLAFKEEQEVEAYWNSREAIDEYLSGRGVASFEGRLPQGGVRNLATYQNLLQAWLDDPSGDESKVFLRRYHPELWAFAFPKSYWGPGGAPPEIASFDQWVDQVESGLRQPFAPDVFMQRMARAGVASDREVAIVEAFGNDPTQSAIGILGNWQTFQNILEESRFAYSALDWMDDRLNGSNYLNWQQRNFAEEPVLMEDLSKQWRELAEAAALLEDITPTLDQTAAERREFVSTLRTVASGYRGLIAQWDNDAERANYNNPREQKLNWYFDNVVAPYYENLADMYDKVDLATDSEDRSRAYDAIRAYNSQEWITKVFDPESGLEFPNTMTWAWDKKSDEEKAERLLRWVAMRPEWLDLQATQKLIERSPALIDFLPSTPEEMAPYIEFSALRSALADMAEPGEDGSPGVSTAERRKLGEYIDERLRIELVQQGRTKELVWMELYPIERLQLAGLLPASLERWAAQAKWIREQLATQNDGEGLGPTSTVGKRLFDIVFSNLLQEMAADPTLREDFFTLGETMWDEQTEDAIFPRLMFGDDFGEV